MKNETSDFRPQEETRKPCAAIKAKREEWRRCKKTADWDTIYQGSEGQFPFVELINYKIFFLRSWQLYLCTLQVQLQHKMKQEAEQFRQWKASREKELLQVGLLNFIKMSIVIIISLKNEEEFQCALLWLTWGHFLQWMHDCALPSIYVFCLKACGMPDFYENWIRITEIKLPNLQNFEGLHIPMPKGPTYFSHKWQNSSVSQIQ